jgi:acyl carrier protein
VKKTEFLGHVAELLDTSVTALTDEADLQGLGWDSLASVSFLGIIDEHFGVVISPKKIAECQTIADLTKLVEDRIEV